MNGKQHPYKKQVEEEDSRIQNLDPPSNHLYYHHHHQNRLLNSRLHAEEEQKQLDTELSPVPLQPPKKHRHLQKTTSSSSRMATRGEIVEVQGGHIIRSTGRKDRHSKVCTAKGPRDRRVRLSAHTAIQFYDVQDRLGFDRPSKAVDWLINKAKSAIDDLAMLPPWNPTTQMNQQNENQSENDDPVGVLRTSAAADASGGGCGVLEQLGENPNGGSSGFLSADIADTMKSLFPMGATVTAPAPVTEANSSSVQFQSYPSPDLVSRSSSSSQSQDLRLSLQSFQDPILLHQAQSHHLHDHQDNKQLFTPMGFDGDSYTEEHGRLHRMAAWNADAADTGHGGGGGGGFVFNSPSPMSIPSPALLGQSQYFSQRGTLQSSNTQSIRAWNWIDPSSITDHHHQQHYLSPTLFHHQSAISGGIGFASGGFSGFRIPARIQGEEEEHDGVSNKPSSASSDSRH